MLDDIDRRLLRRLHDTPGAAVSALARAAGISSQMAARRLERLRAEGVLTGVHAVIDWRALGYAVEVSLRITLDKTEANAFDQHIAAAREVPEVIEIQTFLGRVDVRLYVVARDMAHWQDLYRRRILTLPHIAEIEALVDVGRIKTGGPLPI
jgi:Lrp/AsnC family transcriptional regulator